jgi:hypothetical protein
MQEKIRGLQEGLENISFPRCFFDKNGILLPTFLQIKVDFSNIIWYN